MIQVSFIRGVKPKPPCVVIVIISSELFVATRKQSEQDGHRKEDEKAQGAQGLHREVASGGIATGASML
ncbi:MAG: hypothetical protein IH823_04510 [Candidatus Dadabacteria bacterium]|nr:hypothetical protein [Candidatus Dadabacteria bacterium]